MRSTPFGSPPSSNCRGSSVPLTSNARFTMRNDKKGAEKKNGDKKDDKKNSDKKKDKEKSKA